MAGRNGEVFFACAIMSEHGLVAKEVKFAGNSECAGSLGNLALLFIRPLDWIRGVYFLVDISVVSHVFETDGNLF